MKILTYLDVSPNKTKIVSNSNNYIKIDSSKLKTKSNSVTSNISNANNLNNINITSSVNSNNALILTSSSNQSLLKNYYFNKNATKFTNVSYLNLKKNDYSLGRGAPSEKHSVALINTLSSASIEKNVRKHSRENSEKK